MSIARWIVALFRRPSARDTQATPPVRLPWDCPACGSRIERQGDIFSCVGCRDRGEVERYLGTKRPAKMGPVPTHVQQMPPCGWTGKAVDFGKTWA